MSVPALAIATGFVAGVLSGAFGIGGGLVTTPAIRIVLGYPALVAVGTPLLVILPTAAAGAVSYRWRGLADVRTGIMLGLSGSVTSVLGAWLSDEVGGTAILLLTAVLIMYVALVTVRDALGSHGRTSGFEVRDDLRAPAVVGVGLATGLYSGLLGLGGGFVLVPMLEGFFGMPIKKAIGTSLVAVAFLAVPGAIAHWLLGHVDLTLALALGLGVIPGALIGARLTAAADERLVRLAFAALLLGAAVLLAAGELGWTA